jgi:transposase
MTAAEEIAILRAENAALREQLAGALAEIQALKGHLAKDRHNSSQPPSSDGLARKTKSLRQKSGKKPGGQPGHRGHQVRLVATPDVVVVHRPARCSGCQQLLLEDAPRWIERRQVQELPPIRLQVTEHLLEHVRCPVCGVTTEAEAPVGVSAPRQYGPRVRAVATYLVQQQFVPSARTQERLADLFGTSLSVGTLVNLVRQGAQRLQPVAEAIRAA